VAAAAGDAPAPAQGRQLAESGRCPECHGPDGQGLAADDASAAAPRLAGQRLDYLVKQFRDFASGRRHSDAMSIIARDGEEEVEDILRYFAALPRHAGAAARGAAGAGPHLYQDGDLARAIRPCAECHGPRAQGGRGRLGPVPQLAGQAPSYLARQLRDWRNGERRNSPDNVMNQEASALTDREIDELADWLGDL
jgi:cytochrome c553